MLRGQHWWAGVVSQSDLMPFTAESPINRFDFDGNTAGQPRSIGGDHNRGACVTVERRLNKIYENHNSRMGHTMPGTMYGARYTRVSILFASASPGNCIAC